MDPRLPTPPDRRAARGAVAAVACWGLAFGSGGRMLAKDPRPAPAATSLPARVSFNEQIRPIFASRCVKCHGGVKQAGGLSLIYRDLVLSGGDSGMPAITPGDAGASYLFDRISDADPESRMPPHEQGPPLEPSQIALVRRWIEQGAPWEEAWALVRPRETPPPQTSRPDWPRRTLDQYVLAGMESAGLSPAAEATKAVWLRRVFLDLTGIPPAPADYQEFERDDRPDARERMVDQLLASPRFGERWASMWLDLARYADTVGFERDPHRDIWPYRDWVIRALNSDMPFDEFTIKQLAGDLLPHPTLGDRLATAFHRNTQTNTEGGTDDEEYRTAAVIDRVNTTWQAWQGVTFGCAQCHSHPYEPIENHEYYQFLAFFNNTCDQDVVEEYPLLAVPRDESKWPRAEALDEQIAAVRKELHDLQWSAAKDDALWRRLTPSALRATGETRLVVRTDPTDGVAEVRTEGTVSSYGTFTVELPPAALARLTAIRIEALPLDVAQALKIPETGFVLSRLAATVVSGERAVPAKLAVAFCDELSPTFDPDESLNANDIGWGAYSRLSRPSTAVFVFKKPIAIKPEDRLRLELVFNRTDSGEGALAIQRGRFSATDRDELAELATADDVQKLREKLAALVAERAGIASVSVPVMQDLPTSAGRRSYEFLRGSWLNRGDEVTPGTPKVFPQLPAGVPADRLALAKWLVSKQNPLTARVLVNRLWGELFGVGIVETAEDFGTSGSPPANVALLDSLALRLQNDFHWSVKQMLREVTLSATYAQEGAATPEKLRVDPRNRLLSRGPRTRLTAEMIRDQALAVSGRLSTKMFGPPVMPPQPPGVWRSVYSGEDWSTSAGEDRYRRAVYTYCKRTSGYPSLLTFDMPSRDVCTARRLTTNTPLQALATLNDEAYVDLAKAFAERMAGAGPEPAEQVASGYYIATGRQPANERLERLLALYREAEAEFDADAEAARKLVPTRGRYGLTIVANTLLNLDEVLTK